MGDVLFAYNNNWQPRYNWQSHAGAVDVNTTPEGEDTYADGLAGTSRPAGLIYSKKRVFPWDYGPGGWMDDVLGRVLDHRWSAYNARADCDRYTYGYDRASNRLYRENTLTTGRNELYGYDGLNRRIKSHIDRAAPSNPSGIDTYVDYYYKSAWQILADEQVTDPTVPGKSARSPGVFCGMTPSLIGERGPTTLVTIMSDWVVFSTPQMQRARDPANEFSAQNQIDS